MTKQLLVLVCVAALSFVPSVADAAAILYGVTGDGAATPESLFTLSTSDASSTFVMALGRGTDGEAIGFNPTDGLLYHASGHFGAGVIFESILSDFSGTVDIPIGAPLDDEEAQALTWDSSRGEFLWKQHHLPGPLFSVATDGTETFIGDMDHQAKGLAFVGDTLFSIDRGSGGSATLFTIDPSDASSIGSVTIFGLSSAILGGTGLATNPDDGSLWALLRTSEDSGFRSLVTIDPVTGNATLVGVTDETGFAGLAFVGMDVPEPASFTLLTLGLGAIALVRRKRT